MNEFLFSLLGAIGVAIVAFLKSRIWPSNPSPDAPVKPEVPDESNTPIRDLIKLILLDLFRDVVGEQKIEEPTLDDKLRDLVSKLKSK